MPHTDFYRLLGSSMELLRTGTPDAYGRLGDVLNGLRARLDTEDGAREITFVDGEFEQTGSRNDDIDVDVSFSGDVVLDLVDGRSTFEDLIFDESIRVRGEPPVVERYYEALTLFVGGAIRLPGFLPLLEDYRSYLSARQNYGNRETS